MTSSGSGGDGSGRSRPRRLRPARRPAVLALLLLVAGAAALATLAAPAVAAPADVEPAPDPQVAPDPIRLVPPAANAERLVVEVLVLSSGVSRVEFFLDERPLGADRAAPFRMRIDPALLHRPGGPASPTLRAEAFARDGTALGGDRLTLGTQLGSFAVAIREARLVASGTVVEVAVEVAVPPGARLTEVELFHNQASVETWTAPPFTTHLVMPERAEGAAPRGAPGYLRAVARLADGSALEDAVPLTGTGLGERVDVNLVELFAVASDRRGRPRHGLAADDFRVLLDGDELTIARFREADQVPLTIGLLVDSSDSMRDVLGDTKEAARRFLDRTLIAADRAFLVDIDTSPSLVQALTGSAEVLAAAFPRLEPGGNTALWDSIAFAVVELARLEGRRALVVLTDGKDVSSQWGAHHCRDLARRTGVPVYILSLEGLARGRTNYERDFRLEGVVRATGGRIFHIETPAELDRAYATIEGELRSQYVLDVAVDRLLTDDELAALEVRPRVRGLNVRTARSRSIP